MGRQTVTINLKKDKIIIITVTEKQIHAPKSNFFSFIGGVAIFSMNKNETLNMPLETSIRYFA